MEKEGQELDITELRLGIPGDERKIKKRVFSEISNSEDEENCESNWEDDHVGKIQAVGWPPVCSYRRKNGYKDAVPRTYVKVSLDGVPFLRKIDLGVHEGYEDLGVALEKLFGCFRIGGRLKDFESCEYVPIYEDKDGDWMLAGDVPWQMFIESCKRLRIMKKSDAIGFRLEQTDQ